MRRISSHIIFINIMSPLRKVLRIIWNSRNPALSVEAEFQTDFDHASIVQRQLDAFNVQWKRIRKEYAFYSWWAKVHDLPEKIESLEQLNTFPILTRQDLIQNRELVFSGRESNPMVTTGGSTGDPLRLPTSSKDIQSAAISNWKARSWYGISRFDRYVHIWGHAHHLGRGYRKFSRQIMRAGKDVVGNAFRISVYLVDEKSMLRQLAQILEARPSYIVGFSSAITRLAKTASHHAIHPTSPNLRAIILTADNASDEDIQLIESVFNAPVAIEYGAIETGVIAHSKGASYPLHVFTDRVILNNDVEGQARVTTLERLAFPLINYEIGDLISADFVVSGSILTINKLNGRTHERLRISDVDGKTIEFDARLAFQSLKKHQNLVSIQFIESTDRVHAVVVSTGGIQGVYEDFVNDLTSVLGPIDRSAVKIDQRDKPVQTIAGKVPLIIR